MEAMVKLGESRYRLTCRLIFRRELGIGQLGGALLGS